MITKCLLCNKEFKIFMRDVRRNRGKYCSKKCAGKAKTKKIERKCKICGKLFYTIPYRIKRGEGIYCSHQCMGKGNAAVRIYPKKVLRKCTICGKLFEIIPCRLKLYKHGGLYCSKRCQAIHNNRVMPKISSIEIKTEGLLNKLGVKYEKQYPVEGIALVDFFIKPNIIIQCDGSYWHSLKKTKTKDINQDFLLTFKGYSILRLTEDEINKFSNKCIYKIRRILNADYKK